MTGFLHLKKVLSFDNFFDDIQYKGDFILAPINGKNFYDYKTDSTIINPSIKTEMFMIF